MPPRRPKTVDLDVLLRARERVVTHEELREAGVAQSTIGHRIRPGGPWQRLLPGVVLAHSGTPTHRERTLGALRYIGPAAVVTGATALRAYGVRAAPRSPTVSVLQPPERQRSSYGLVTVSRTRRMPQPLTRQGVPYAPVARAVIDAAREMDDLDAVRELVAEVVQRRMCRAQDIVDEVYGAARQRTALSRRVVHEIGVGIRSVAEAKARAAYQTAGVPEPLWNADLLTEDGEFLARPDGYWEAVAAALEIDSMRWHLGPEGYRRTQERQRGLTVHGVLVLPVSPAFVVDDTEAFVRATWELLAEASRRAAPTGLVVRLSA